MEKTNNVWRWLVPLAVGSGIWICPHGDFDASAWGLLCIFAATISGLISRPLPMGALVIIAITTLGILGILTTREALSGFSNSTVWLVVAAFIFAKGFKDTRLGERIAYYIIAAFGKSSLRLGYSLVLADLVIAPVTASNTARAGGILSPIAQSMARAFDSHPGPSAKRLGAYLIKTVYQTDLVISAMFMTASAANPVVVEIARQVAGIEITWSQWALAALVPGIVGIIVVPYVVYRLYPPEIKDTEKVQHLARNHIKEMGPVTREQRVMSAVVVLVLCLWVTGSMHGISSTMAAYVGISGLLLFRVLSWEDILGEKSAWNTLIWFGGLIMMAGQLSEHGLLVAFANSAAELVEGWSWPLALCSLLLVYLYIHYAFASSTAHVLAVLPAFLAVAISLGSPPLLAALAFGYFSSIYASLTHYGIGAAVVLYGAGYVSQTQWWRVGFLLSLVHVAIWLPIGFAWWKVIGLW